MEMKERICKLLFMRKMSQKELAEAANVTEAAVSRYMSGERTPKGAILLNIANALGSSMEYLTGESEMPFKASREEDLDQAFTLIARNAKDLTPEERQKFAKLLFS